MPFTLRFLVFIDDTIKNKIESAHSAIGFQCGDAIHIINIFALPHLKWKVIFSKFIKSEYAFQERISRMSRQSDHLSKKKINWITLQFHRTRI